MPAPSSVHRRVAALPLLLLALLSLSPAWAGAFRGGIPTTIIHHRRPSSRAPTSVGVDGTFHMKNSPRFTRSPPSSSPSLLSLTRLALLRGGQVDEETVASDETASLDADGMRRNYGTHDEESAEAAEVTAAHLEVDVEPADEAATETSSSVSSPVLAAMAPATSLLKAAAAFYTQQLTARPILTKSLTAGIIFGLSDWCAQLIERGDESDKDPLVFSRILTAFLVGVLFFGPAANAWYAMIFKFLPSTSLFSTLQKAALGQIIFGPAFTCVFFGAGMIQAGSFSPGAWLEKIRTDLPQVWASGLGFWPLVDFISYKVVPVQWIPLFVNFCSFVWTIYLSLVSNRGDAGAEDA